MSATAHLEPSSFRGCHRAAAAALPGMYQKGRVSDPASPLRPHQDFSGIHRWLDCTEFKPQ